MGHDLYSVLTIPLKVIQFTGCMHLKLIQNEKAKISSSLLLFHLFHIFASIFICCDAKYYILMKFTSLSIFRFLNFIVYIVLASPIIVLTDLKLMPKLKFVFDTLIQIDQQCSKTLYQNEKILISTLSVCNIFLHLFTYILELVWNPFEYKLELIFRVIFRSYLLSWMMNVVVLEIILQCIICRRVKEFFEMVTKGEISLGKLKMDNSVQIFYLIVSSAYDYFAPNNLIYVTMAFDSNVVAIMMILYPRLASFIIFHYFLFCPFLTLLFIFSDVLYNQVSKVENTCKLI